MHKDNWDDLRFILAVAESGSVNAAARALGVNHATVLRRIAGFEHRHGAQVFDRSANGYSVRADQQNVITAARQVENAVLGVDRAMRSAHKELSGAVVITSTDTLCTGFLPAITGVIEAAHPDLNLTLLSGNTHLDLSRLRADITVRPAAELDPSLTGEAAGILAFAVYQGANAGTGWLGFYGPLAQSRPGQWMADHVRSNDISQRSDSFLVLRELAAAGCGRSILPCFIGDADDRLQRVAGGVSLSVPLWVASQSDLAETPRFRVVRDMLAKGLLDQAAQLRGTATPS